MDVGVVVNPIAGMGGRVGLKGTDGKLEEARERGAQPRAPARARDALESLRRHAPDCTLYTAADTMGEEAARDAGFEPKVVTAAGDAATREESASTSDGAETTAEDTRAAVRAFLEAGVDLVLFVGGDGTAVDVAGVLEAVEGEHTGDENEHERTPMLGVPAGVKIYSSVFAVTPADAGRVAAEFERIEFREVNDIDEDAYREGEVRSELRAIVPVPVAPALQSSKQLASGSVDSLASGFAREIDSDRIYIFGPGSTVGAIESELEIEPSPLGIDIWHDGDVLARDAAEADILEVLADRDADVTVVVSPIGGQGFIFGRGNHQLSPAVLEQADDIQVVASETKLDGIDALHVDTDDATIDDELRGWIRVRTGRFTTRLIQVV
ncbi:ATP-NAD kinase family protein [Natronolimnobius baerhuensis]|uniref:N-acetylglucosamine-1-phosphate uridyltransferase n=1 Tax=Natronolimnobius baerhuensis TaxID=253108 RepID=A0A202EBR0_9EURY|nr:ATP-NAD kinase family protein [Natronolimnobius baerhuensis]OVE85696.1 N-acetylglucosamine-1-phosphate uridyltransferase [Natronolimnobius baerhuensis]